MNRYVLLGGLWLLNHRGLSQAVTVSNVRPVYQTFASREPFRFRPGDSTVQLTYRQNGAIVSVRSPMPDPLFSFRIRRLTTDSVVTRDTFLFLPNLPNGNMTLTVRDIRHPKLRPARLYLSVEAPLWLRWWFLPMLFLYLMVFVSGALYLLYRYRIRQFMRLQAIRDRIARDLHDDMGSSLSSISIMSQTATRHPDQAGPTLALIGETARQVMDSMSDIVWSVNPRHDATAMLVERMRQRADELFDGQATEISFSTGPGVTDLTLTLEQQRDFFLIYKEALTNAARYAHARHIEISLTQAHRRLLLNLSDDGVGFDPSSPSARPDHTAPANRRPEGGNGLTNIRTRAESLGAVLLIQSQPGHGTVIRLEMPV